MTLRPLLLSLRRRHSLAPVTAMALALASAISAVSCGGGNERPVPKPDAWPRIEAPAAEYEATELGGLTLRLNKAAEVSTRTGDNGEGVWADISYPAFPGATIYLSIVETDGQEKLARAIDNRRERMMLNAGGAQAKTMSFTTANGWHGELVSSHSSVTTPSQILGHDGKSRLLFGSLYLDYPAGTSPDSIAPIVQALGHDMLELITNVSFSPEK